MYKDIEISEDLLYLEHSLHCLSEYNYGKEINSLLRELRLKVSEKLYANFPKEDKENDFETCKIIFRYFLEK